MAKRKKKTALKVSGLNGFYWVVQGSKKTPGYRFADCMMNDRSDPWSAAKKQAREHVDKIEKWLAESEKNGPPRNFTYLLIGVGLGYYPRALRDELYARNLLWRAYLCLWDPFPAARAEVQKYMSQAWDEDWHVVNDAFGWMDWAAWVVREDPHAIRVEPNPHPGLFDPPGNETIRFEMDWVRSKQTEARGRTMRDMDVLSKVPSRRMLGFYRSFPKLDVLARVMGQADGRTAMVVSQGPSLRPDLVQRAKDMGAVVFASVQALKTLNGAGVVPHYAVLADPSNLVCGQLDCWEPKFDRLICDTLMPKRIFDRWEKKIFLFHLRSAHTSEVIWNRLGIPQYSQPWLTVGEIMHGVAWDLGCTSIIANGIDYADPGRGGIRIPKNMSVMRAESIAGSPVFTHSHYYHGAKYVSVSLRLRKDRLQDAMRITNGIPVEGFDDLLVDEPKTNLLFDALLEKRKMCLYEPPETTPHPEWRRLVDTTGLEWALTAHGNRNAPDTGRLVDDLKDQLSPVTREEAIGYAQEVGARLGVRIEPMPLHQLTCGNKDCGLTADYVLPLGEHPEVGEYKVFSNGEDEPIRCYRCGRTNLARLTIGLTADRSDRWAKECHFANRRGITSKSKYPRPHLEAVASANKKKTTESQKAG